MLPVNFNHLYYFWAVAKAGGFSAAQRELFLTQSALSLQVQSLERSLGRRLLARGRLGVTLTPDGKKAFTFCDRFFGQGEEFVRGLKEDKPLPPPPLRLGALPTLSRGVLLQIVDHVTVSSPGTRVRVTSGLAEDLRDRLARRTVDLVAADSDLSVGMGPDYRSRLVTRLPLYFVASRAWKKKVVVFPRDLDRVPLLLRAPDSPTRKEVDHYLYAHGLNPVIAAEVEDAGLLEGLVAAGRGAAAVDALTARSLVAARAGVRLHARPLPLTQNLWFVFRRHHQEDPLVQGALDLLMDTFQPPPSPRRAV